jgi:hypothetical protein
MLCNFVVRCHYNARVFKQFHLSPNLTPSMNAYISVSLIIAYTFPFIYWTRNHDRPAGAKLIITFHYVNATIQV